MTRYVDRFHPAALIAEYLNEPEILEVFRLINGAPGIVEAIIRWYGPIRWTGRGFIKEPDYDGPTPLEIVAPVVAASAEDQRKALRVLMLERYGTVAFNQYRALGFSDEEVRSLTKWRAQNAWVTEFANQWREFRLALLPFFEEMHHITKWKSRGLRDPGFVILTAPMHGDIVRMRDHPALTTLDPDVGTALFGSLATDIYGALRSNAIYTLCKHTRGRGNEFFEMEIKPASERIWEYSEPMVRGFGNRSEQSDQRFRVNDDLIGLMLDSLDREPRGVLTEVLINIKNVMAALITADPTFVLRNATRDMLSSFVLGRAWMVPVFDTFRGTGDFARDSDLARQWFLQGGASSTLIETAADDPEHVEPMTAFAVRSRSKRWARKCRRIYNTITSPARALEAGTRITQFRRMLATGVTPRQAALASRAVSTDFANRGAADDLITLIIRTTVFLNAAIQGLNEARKVALTESGMGGKTKRWGGKSGKFWGAGLIGLTSLSFVAWIHSTSTPERLEEYEALTTYHKTAYVHFTGLPGPQGHLRIPVPFEVGFLFQKLPEIVWDAVTSLDTNDTDPLTTGLVPPTARHILQTSFLLTGIPVPSAVAPILDQMRNRNFFGGEIVPYYMMNRPAPARHFRSTPPFYIAMGEAFNASPLVLKHYLEGYGGNAMRNLVEWTKWVGWDESAHGERPFPSGFLRATGMEAFSTRPYRSTSRWANDYYALADEVGYKCYMAKRLRSKDFVDANRKMLKLCGWKKGFEKRLTGRGARIHTRLVLNGGLSQAEKESAIQEAYERRDRIFRNAYISARKRLTGS